MICQSSDNSVSSGIAGLLIGMLLGAALLTLAIASGCASMRTVALAPMRESVKKELMQEAVQAGIATWVVIDNEGHTKLQFYSASATRLLGESQ